MKNKLSNILVLIILLLTCVSTHKNIKAQSKQHVTTTITAMTYNIWSVRPGGLTEEVLQDIATVIKQVNPDVVALQEVDKNTKRNPIDVMKKLSELTNMEYLFAKAMDYQGGEYGEGILYKLPIRDKKIYSLGTTPELGGEPRAMACITVEKEGKEFYFIGTHLDHLHKEGNRIKQAKDIVDTLKLLDPKPTIFCGDLNADPVSKSIMILREYLSLGCPGNECLPTYPSPVKKNPPVTLDYLLHAPGNRFTVKSYQVYTQAGIVSDHLPVVATYEIH